MPRTGRPTKIDAELRRGPDGEKITVADEIVERIRSGASNLDAAQSVGISKSTLQDWLREGARASARRLAGEKLTAKERRLADFSDREAQALAEWKVEQEIQLGILSTGRERLIVTEKRDSAGNLIEKSERREGIEPNAQVIEWRLERRFPEQYGRQRLEITGPEGGPIPLSIREQASEALASAAERLAEGLAALQAQRDGSSDA